MDTSWTGSRPRACALGLALLLAAGCGDEAAEPGGVDAGPRAEVPAAAGPPAATPARPTAAAPVAIPGANPGGAPGAAPGGAPVGAPGGASEPAAARAADTVPRGAPGREWTAGNLARADRGVGMTTLAEVRAARNAGFDRVVFQFQGDTLPGYHTEYVDRPVRQCGSGEPVEIAGDGWLYISLSPARAHDDQGRATVANRAQRPELPVLRELRLVCDFEGEVAWVLGVHSPNRYRVLELSEPTRLVIDVRH